MKDIIIILLLTALVFTLSACYSYDIFDPNTESLKIISSPSFLLDSLHQNKLTAGVPYIIVSEIFKNYPENVKKIQVAGIGSRQKLLEKEGAGRVYSDPFLDVNIDHYETNSGVLDIWYQKPDFYVMDISSGDTIVFFYNNTIHSSVVKYLQTREKLTISDSLGVLPVNTNLYAEIHYRDNQWRQISYWYSVRILRDGRTVVVRDLQYGIYPIEKMELNNQPITSFKWRP